MAQSNGFNLGQLLGPRSVIQADQLAADAGAAGVTTYTSIGDLPSSGLTSGDMAFVDSSDRLYIWTGAGWYNVALINQTPAIQSILDSDGLPSPFVLSNEGATTTITMIAADPDGFPVSYIAVADSDFNAMATLSQVSNVFTITPTAIENSTGTITFKASDGINLASEISTFVISFAIYNSKYTSLLVQSVGANNGTNSTFTDASTNNLTVTAGNGTPVTNTFSPYRAGGYSTLFDGNGDYLTLPASTNLQMGSGSFTWECWIYATNLSVPYSGIIEGRSNSPSTTTAGLLYFATDSLKYYSNSVDALSYASFPTNTWTHVALVRNGASAITLYVNGTSVATGTSATVLSSPVNRIGNTFDNYEFNGYISNLRIVKGTALYTSNFTPPTEALTAITDTVLLTCQSNRFVDNSVSAHAITVFGNTSVVPFGLYDYLSYDPAVNGGSVYFDGASTLNIATNTGFGFGTGDFTIECWVNWSGGYGTANSAGILGFRSAVAAEATLIQITTANTTPQFSIYDGPTGIGFQSTTIVQPGTWYHVVSCRSGTTWRLFVNGVIENTRVSGSDLGSSKPLVIGSLINGLTATKFSGNISDIRIVKGTAVYTSAFTPPTEPLTAISGTSLLINATASIIDASQSTSALTLVGNARSSTTQIKYGNSSMYFDGTGDYVSIPSSTNFDFGTGDFTLETWANLSALSTNRVLIDKWSTGNVNSWQLYWRSSGTSIVFYVGSTIVVQDPNPSNIVVGEWNHIALSKSGTTVRLFINGIVVATNTSSVSYTNTRPIGLGVQLSTATNYLSGYMQDVRITKGLARYTTTFTPPAVLLEG